MRYHFNFSPPNASSLATRAGGCAPIMKGGNDGETEDNFNPYR